MEINVKIPILTSAAGSGITWTKEQLSVYANKSGVYIHHCDVEILYVGKTNIGKFAEKFNDYYSEVGAFWEP